MGRRFHSRFHSRPRPSAFGSFSADLRSILFRSLSLLIVLGLVYSWARKPETWRWLTDGPESNLASAQPPTADSEASAPGKKGAAPETVVPGPTDQDAAEAAAARPLFEAVSDRSTLSEVEMPAYWRCLKWAQAQSFADLDRRAQQRIVYTQLWEQPDKYRGKLVRLRLHLRRILDWEAPKNSAGVKRVYEAWGWTDESKSFPYVVVFSELPGGMKLGDNVQEEGLFVGYFLKTILYTASNRNRSSPLLLGRIKLLEGVRRAPPLVGRNEWTWFAGIGIPLFVLALIGTWLRLRHLRSVKLPLAPPPDEAEMENWFRDGAGPPDAGESPPNQPLA